MAKLFSELFSINGTWLWPPDGYQEEPVPVVGYNLSGEPVRQGCPAITFTWSFMRQEHLSALLAQFKPNKPRVKIRYINREKGAEAGGNGLISAFGMMHEPVIGARQIVYSNNIAVKFSHIEETAPALSDSFDLSMTGWTVGNVSSGATARFSKDTTRFVSAPDSGTLRFDGSARANDRADAWNPGRYRLIDSVAAVGTATAGTGNASATATQGQCTCYNNTTSSLTVTATVMCINATSGNSANQEEREERRHPESDGSGRGRDADRRGLFGPVRLSAGDP